MVRKPLRPGASPVTDEELAFISTPDFEVRESAANLSFDKVKLAARLVGDPWALVVQCHLYHDHILTLTLAENLPNAGAINLDRMSFANKMDLARALDLAPAQLAAFWKKLNKVRNSIAHDLDYEVTEVEIAGLKAAMPTYVKDAAQDGIWSPKRPLSLQEILILTIFIADRQRQAVAGQRLISRKYGLMLKATVAGQDFPLDP